MSVTQPLKVKLLAHENDKKRENIDALAHQLCAASEQTCENMLFAVLSHAAEVSGQQQRFHGYSPEEAFRAVRTLVNYSRLDALQSLLEKHLRIYSTMLAKQGLGPMMEAASTANLSSSSSSAAAGVSDSASVTAACFHRLVSLWERFVSAMDEIQTVWSLFNSCHYVQQRSPAKDMAGAAVPFFIEALESSPQVFDAALAGFVAEVRADATASCGSTIIHSKDNEEEESEMTPSEVRHTALRSFTSLTLAAHMYLDRVQPAVVTELNNMYEALAQQMYLDDVSCFDYFTFVEKAIARERERCKLYLSPLTAPLLQRVTEETLVGRVGVEVMTRDFAEVFAAEGDGGHAALALMWRVFSSCVHVPRTPVVTMMHTHVMDRAAVLIKEMIGTEVAAAAAAAASPASPILAAEARRGGAMPFLRFIQLARRVISRCFAGGEKELQAQLDGDVQSLISADEKPIAEHLAAFVDHVFKDLENGTLPLRAPSATVTMKRARTEEPTITTTATTRAARAGGSFANEEENDEDEEGRNTTKKSAGSSPTTNTTSSVDNNGEAMLESVAYICAHFPTRDLFEQLHWRDLGRRLLHPYRVANRQAELFFLRVFEGIYGNSFISKFETMLKDASVSEGLTEQYRLWVSLKGQTGSATATTSSSSPTTTTEAVGASSAAAASAASGSSPPAKALSFSPQEFDQLPKSLEVNLRFLTFGCWPQCTPMDLLLPASLQRVTQSVSVFYSQLHPNRHLVWQHQLAHGVLHAQLRPNAPSRQLSGTLVQCITLMHLDKVLIREGDSITVGEVCSSLGVDLEAPEVMGALLGMCHERFGLLQRISSTANTNPSSGAITTTPTTTTPLALADRLALNLNFSSASPRVRIPFQSRVLRAADAEPVANEATAEEAEEALYRQRGYLLEVAVMQFMKANAVAKHDALIEHLQTKNFSFQVTITIAKKAIEKLLNRGFIERDGPSGYKYVA